MLSKIKIGDDDELSPACVGRACDIRELHESL